jgi:hypothetical protein
MVMPLAWIAVMLSPSLLYNSEAEHRADVNEVQTGTLWLTVVPDRRC